MKIIKCLSEKIEDELQDAKEYIEKALKLKSDDPDTAELFYELSTEEMDHMSRLHQRVQEIIEEQEEKSGEPPKDMLTLYEYLHEKHTASATEIKVKQAMFKMGE